MKASILQIQAIKLTGHGISYGRGSKVINFALMKAIKPNLFRVIILEVEESSKATVNGL